jgi:hypothetical protein
MCKLKALALVKEHRIEDLKVSLGLMVRFFARTVYILEKECFPAASRCI